MKKKAVIAFAAAAAAVAVIAAVAVAVALIVRHNSADPGSNGADPLENTLLAVFPTLKNLSEADSAKDENLDVTCDLRAVLANDFSDGLSGSPMEISLGLSKTADGRYGSRFAMGAGADTVDISIRTDPEKVILSSDRLTGRTVSVGRVNVRGALEGSVFAPKSGSEFSLSEELFDAVCESAEKILEKKNEQEREPGDSAEKAGRLFDRISEVIKERSEKTTSTADVDIYGGQVRASVVTFRSTDGFGEALSEALGGTDGLEAVLGLAGENGEESIGLPDLSDMSFTASIAVKGAYLVRADLIIDYSGDGEGGHGDISILFCERPDLDPSFRAVLKSDHKGWMLDVNLESIPSEGGRTVKIKSSFEMKTPEDLEAGADDPGFLFELNLTAVRNGENWSAEGDTGRFSGNKTGTGRYSSEKHYSFSLTGRTEKNDSGFLTAADSVRVFAWTGQGTRPVLNLSKSRVEFEYKIGEATYANGGDGEASDFFSMTDVELKSLIEELSSDYEQACESVNGSSGSVIFSKTPKIVLVGTSKASGIESEILCDTTNGSLFIVYSEYGAIVQVDPESFRILNSVSFGCKVLCADADGGYLAVGLPDGAAGSDITGPNLVVLDSKTLGQINVFRVPPAPGAEAVLPAEVVVDGSTAAVIAGTENASVYLLDLVSGESRVCSISPNCGPVCINRKEHTVGLLSLNEYGQIPALYLFDSLTGKLVKKIKIDSYEGGGIYFDGRYFHVGNKYYDRSGTEIPTNKKSIKNNYTLDEVIFIRDGFRIINEHEVGKGYMCNIYCDDGKMFENPFGLYLVGIVDMPAPLLFGISYDMNTGDFYISTYEVGFTCYPSLSDDIKRLADEFAN